MLFLVFKDPIRRFPVNFLDDIYYLRTPLESYMQCII